MKYKVGDRVRVREDLVVGRRYRGIDCLQSHKKECGKIFTIRHIEWHDYLLNGSILWWSEEMLEEVDEMKYKVGDRVRVRKNLVDDKFYGTCAFNPDMRKYIGRVTTVVKVCANKSYILAESDWWHWTDEMLEEVKMGNVKIKIAVDGNKVIAKMGKETGVARCHPGDEFDVFAGAKLALERLEEKCKPYAWLKREVRYYVPHLIDDDLFIVRIYNDTECDARMINLGLAFKTKEEAIAVAKKMLAVLKDSDEQC